MTTIATDGKTIAADGLRTAGYRPTERASRKVIYRDGRLYAIAGLFAMRDALIAWHQMGADPTKVPTASDKDGWGMFVIDATGVAIFSVECPYAEIKTLPAAIGSGSEWAIAGMKLGLSPRDAVAFAIENDVFSGGEIFAWDIAATFAAGVLMPAEPLRIAAE